MLLIEVIVCLIAGLGAGIGTGFAGMSAASIITPILFTFLGIPVYEAIGIALASDVLASAVSAYTYKKNDNIDIKNALVMLVTVLSFTVLGSYISSDVPNTGMSMGSTIAVFILGIKFTISPVRKIKEKQLDETAAKKLVKSIISGAVIGFICGFIGAGGGMMMLLMLTSVLGYDIKKAVGTSVFIMAFTAFTGSVSHFMLNGIHYLSVLIFCIISTLVFARVAAVIANKSSEKVMGRTVGITLIILGIVVLTLNYA